MKDSSASSSFAGTTRRPVIDPGTLLQGRYRVLRRLGKGGMGAVYEATDLRLDVTVAIKEAFSTDPRLRKQFEHEARLLAQLHHPALPRVTDYFLEADRVFLVMQFIGGDDVAEIIARQPGPLPPNTVIAWADQLLDALIYLHTRERQIIHRDIKPHNLKLTSAGSIALLDFGLAKADSDSTGSNSWTSVFGFTRRYSPPEQMQDQGTTPRSDIYALGATLYHLLTGVKPPDALVRTKAIAKSEADPLLLATEIHSAVGPEVSIILQKALELDPNRRYENAREFREALRRLGRSDMRAIDWNETHTDTSGPPQVNVTVVNKGITFDPFDSYSILKPVDRDWLIPKPSRRPFVVAAVLIIALVGGVVAFTGSDGWASLSTEALNHVQTGSDSMKTASPPRVDVSRVREQSTGRTTTVARDSLHEQHLRKPQNTNSGNKNKPVKNSRGR
jgi:serine/threonine protein kinase